MPAQAQTTIWAATLTVESATGTGSNGYNDGGRSTNSVADFGTLTDGDFEAAGTTYRIETLRWDANDGSDGDLFFEVNRSVPVAAVYNTWTLHIGTDQFAFSDASLRIDESNQFKWENAYDPDDSAKPTPSALNATVDVKITAGSASTNNAPDFSDTTLTRSRAENTVADTNTGMAIPEASDPDGDPLAYSLEGTNEASFNFDTSSRQISTKTGVAYDHEANPSYSVTVRVHDSKGGMDTVAVTNGTDYARFTFKVSDGTHENASTYTMTVNVTAVNDPATGAPTISGTAQKGQTLTAVTAGIADVEGRSNSTYSYQWIRLDADGMSSATDIACATSGTYTPVAADVGKKLKVKVSFTDNKGNDEERTSDAWPSSETIIDPALGICGRTAVVRTALLDKISGVTDCALVTDTHLAAISGTLGLKNMSITSLAAGDFAGLTALGHLHLFKNEFTTLPAGVFDGLTVLTDLLLYGNELTTLPDGVFAPLTALDGLLLSSNPGTPFVPEAVALPDDGTVPVAGGTVTLDGYEAFIRIQYTRMSPTENAVEL